MSFLVTRPEMPVPGIPLMSTLCSAAIFRTGGDDFGGFSPSIDSEAPLPPVESLTERLSAAEPAEAPAGIDLDGGGSLGRAALLGGTAGAGASGAGGAPAGVAGFCGAGAPGEGAAGAFGFSAAAVASVSMRATTVCTATVSPSCTRISASTPAVGAGISASTLSLEISKIG